MWHGNVIHAISLAAAIWGDAATVLGMLAIVVVVRQLSASLHLSGSHTIHYYLPGGTPALKLCLKSALSGGKC